MSAYTDNRMAFRHVRGIMYELLEPVVWRIGHINGPEHIVPAGFIFDVSIPRFLRWLYHPTAREYFKAAALHDHASAGAGATRDRRVRDPHPAQEAAVCAPNRARLAILECAKGGCVHDDIFLRVRRRDGAVYLSFTSDICIS
jgi:hypothetical protein